MLLRFSRSRNINNVNGVFPFTFLDIRFHLILDARREYSTLVVGNHMSCHVAIGGLHEDSIILVLDKGGD